MAIVSLINFDKACDVVRKDGYFTKAKDGLPKNMTLLEKASELQITAFVAHRHGINEHVISWMPAFNIMPSPIKKYQALMIVDRGNKTFVETIDGFKVARVTRLEQGVVEPILNQGKSVIINLSEYRIGMSAIAMFFTAFWAAYQDGKKNSKLKRMLRK